MKLREITLFPTRIEHPEKGEIILVDWDTPNKYSPSQYFAYVVPGEDDGGILDETELDTDVAIIDNPQPA